MSTTLPTRTPTAGRDRGIRPEQLPVRTAVRLIAAREVRTRLRSAGFIAGTLVTMVMVVLLALLPALFGGDDAKSVAVFGLSRQEEAAVRAATGVNGTIKVREVATGSEALSLVRNGEANASVLGATTPGARARITVGKTSDNALATSLAALLERQAHVDELARLGAERDVLAASPTVRFLQDDSGEAQRLVLAYVVSLMLFSQIVGAGGSVAQGVVEEKSTRVIEILLAKVRPTPLLVGKVIGIGLVGLVQLLAVATVGVGVALAAGSLVIESTLVQVAWSSMLWYLLGFVFYGFMYGGVGSMVSRAEELPGLTIPLQLMNTASLIAAVIGLQDIDGTWLAVISYVPPFSAILVPLRMAGDVASTYEIVLPAVILLGATALVAWLGGIVYNRSILHTGQRMRFGQLLRRP